MRGKKFAFRDLNIEENFLVLKKKGACFTLKGHFLLRKKGHFSLRKKGQLLGVGNFWGLFFIACQLVPPENDDFFL